MVRIGVVWIGGERRGEVKSGEVGQGTLTINIQGDIIGDDAFIDDLVEMINKLDEPEDLMA